MLNEQRQVHTYEQSERSFGSNISKLGSDAFMLLKQEKLVF